MSFLSKSFQYNEKKYYISCMDISIKENNYNNQQKIKEKKQGNLDNKILISFFILKINI